MDGLEAEAGRVCNEGDAPARAPSQNLPSVVETGETPETAQTAETSQAADIAETAPRRSARRRKGGEVAPPPFPAEVRRMGRIRSAAVIGVDAMPIEIEAQLFGTLRRLAIVGLPDGALREARDRVRCAVENSGFEFPDGEVVISLSPAGLPKAGSGFDLGIALSILTAARFVPQAAASRVLVLGELGLDGSLRPARGVLAVACLVRKLGDVELLVPPENLAEAALVEGVRARAASRLEEAIAYLAGRHELEPFVPDPAQATGAPRGSGFGDVVGQYTAKRALEIVAAGGHNLLMVGPPGSGKSMLAERLPSILPPLSADEQIEVARIHSAASVHVADGARVDALPTARPYRAPHHSTSAAGLIGGGPMPIPGEISLAHRGVLFLDEVTELRREALEALRQPLEMRHITICRAKFRLQFPADFVLLAAMNPCPCGRKGLRDRSCRCPAGLVSRYVSRISGPILDRIDLQIDVPAVPVDQLRAGPGADPTEKMRERVLDARSRQAARFGTESRFNAHLKPREIREHCRLDADGEAVLDDATGKFSLSARGYSRVLKVARTIADLEGSSCVRSGHLREALSYRMSILTREEPG